MNRIWAILLVLAVLLAGCSGSAPEETTRATEAATEATETVVTTEPEETQPPAPETAAGSVLADRTAVVLSEANRGDVLDVVDSYNEAYHVVKLEAGYGLVEKRLTRLEGAGEYEAWTGYARYGAKLYGDYRLRDAASENLEMNRKVKVLDSLGNVLVVQVEETLGYMDANQVSTYYIAPAPDQKDSGGNSGGVDGGDISLGVRFGIRLLGTFAPQTGDTSGTAIVLADGVPVLLGWFDRGDPVPLITEDGFAEPMEGYAAIYLEGVCGYVRENLIAREGDPAQEPWDGYAYYNAVVYDNYDLTGEPAMVLSANAKIRVLCDLGDCYLVAVGDATGYMAREQISEYYIAYGNSQSDRNTDASGNTEETEATEPEGDEWTPPIL